MASGKILGFLGALLYVLVTLVPDIDWQGLILTPHFTGWPLVLFWQAGLITMVVIFLLRLWPQERPFYLLGNGFDRLCLFLMGAFFLSTLFAQFRAPAIWHTGILFAVITIGYGIFQDLKISQDPMGILRFQALLQVVFMVESLTLWTTFTLLPELDRIKLLANEGIIRSYDFGNLPLQNAYPLGHPNYVAGYVILALPLLLTFALTEKGFWQKLGVVGVVLGIVNLYTSSSRGGFLGLTVMVVVGFGLLAFRSKLSPGALMGGLGAAVLGIGLMIFLNNRLRSLLLGIFSGSGQFFYRAITSTTGWEMGKAHWLLGAGPGATAWFYQKFRPTWAHREAEMAYQLHSTPPQIWAELGLLGVIATLLGLFLVGQLWTKNNRSVVAQKYEILGFNLILALVGYGALALTDYQLDVLAISIPIVIYLAVWLYLGNTKEEIFPHQYRKLTALMGWGVVVAGLVWLAPVDAAWQQSSLGFLHLQGYRQANLKQDQATASQEFQAFQTRLEQSHKLAPWESYYTYQLGWNLGVRGWYEPDRNQAQIWQNEGMAWLRKGIKSNPYQEFGYHNGAWLLQNLGKSTEAEPLFRQGLNLVPGKRSLSFGLGLTLLQQGKGDEGLASIVDECFNDPIFITSPLWRTQQLQGIYPSVVKELEKVYQANATPTAKTNLAVLHWWAGKPNAIIELRSTNNPGAILLSDAIEDKREQLQTVINNPQNPTDMLIAAWYNPSQRSDLLRRAWITATEDLEENRYRPIVDSLFVRMNSVKSFDEFLRGPLPLFTPLNVKLPRNRLGFGIISRHTDGPSPFDFFVSEQNALVTKFLGGLFLEPEQFRSPPKN